MKKTDPVVKLPQGEGRARDQAGKENQPGATPVKVPDLSDGDARDQAGKAFGVMLRKINMAPAPHLEHGPEADR